MNKKKLVVVIASIMMILTIAIGGTLAYFTDATDKENVFTVGNVDIEITEEKWDATGEEEAKDAYAGEALAKDPVVDNVGKNPCFVRVSVTGLDQFGEKGDITTRYMYQNGYNETDWTLVGDYYYYNKVLVSGESTSVVFDQVVMPTGLVGDETTKPIVVYAEAVQAQGAKPSFSAVQAMTVEEIAAWFATCGL